MKGAIQRLFREHGCNYILEHATRLNEQQHKAIGAIRTCGTPNAGVLTFSCRQCGQQHMLERSCGSRICPSCQTAKADQWLDARLTRQLPVHHFLLTFTVPEQLRAFMLHRPKAAFNALFRAASGAIRTLAANPKYIGVDLPGFFGVLHTWGSTLQFHPHIHFVVPGGGIDRKTGLWRSSRSGFYVPVHALSKLIRGRFYEQMSEQALLHEIDPAVWNKGWNVNSQAVGDNAGGVLRYLANYVFKTAITDSRVLSITNSKVAFTYRRKNSKRHGRTVLAANEFIRRFLIHTLPRGFMRIRYYGFMSPACNIPHQRLVRLVEMAQGFEVQTPRHRSMPRPSLRCTVCGTRLIFTGFRTATAYHTIGIPHPARHKIE